MLFEWSDDASSLVCGLSCLSDAVVAPLCVGHVPRLCVVCVVTLCDEGVSCFLRVVLAVTSVVEAIGVEVLVVLSWSCWAEHVVGSEATVGYGVVDPSDAFDSASCVVGVAFPFFFELEAFGMLSDSVIEWARAEVAFV